MSSDDKSLSVLMPPPQMEGGLIKRDKKKNPETNDHTFKVPQALSEKPRGSLLGLDRLAAQKKKEKEENGGDEPGSKRSKIHSYKDEDEYADSTPRQQDKHLREREENNGDRSRTNRDNRNERNYREKNYHGDDKTPTPHRSHHDKISRDKHYRDQKGLYASSNKYGRDDRRRRHDWEEATPDRRGRDRDYDYTPNDKRMKDTPSRSNWEDDDYHRNKSSSRSNWDATPKSGRNNSYSQSHRSSRSKYDTPLPTPVHKHNKWAGRGAGETPRTKSSEDYEMDEEEQRVSLYLIIC